MPHLPHPLEFTWDGEHMRPRHPRAADREYVVGETYRLGVIEDRSTASHNHYFAALAEAWRNLPDEMIEQYPTPEHLRKRALIQAGYRDERSIVCASKAEALRFAAFLRPMDEYGVVVVRGNVALHMTAKSQSMKAMKKQEFEESKRAVLDLAARLIGVEPAVLEANAGMGA